MITIPEIMVPLLRDVRTKDEKDILHDQIAKLEATLFRSDPTGIEKILTSQFPEELVSAMRNIIHDPLFKDNPEALKNFFKDLRDTTDKLPLLTLIIACKPTEEMIIRFHKWTQENLGLGIVLDMSYDGSILGGARIIFGGRYKEMTLAQMITDVFKKEKTAVLGIMK